MIVGESVARARSEVPRLLRIAPHPNYGSVIASFQLIPLALNSLQHHRSHHVRPITHQPTHPPHATMISSGFTNAPVSQFLVFGTVIGALVASLTDTRYYLPIAVVPHIWGYGQLWRVLTWGWVWTNSTEVLFGVLSFYHLRVVERLWGSRKFLVSQALSLSDGEEEGGRPMLI